MGSVREFCALTKAERVRERLESRRPERTYETDRVTIWARRAAILFTAIVTVCAGLVYAFGPEIVPVLFDFEGEPDAFDDRSAVLVLALVFVALITGMLWLSRHPRALNYATEVTVDNAQGLYRAGEQMLVWMGASTAVLFAGILCATLETPGSVIMLVLGGVGIALSLAVGLGRIAKAVLHA